MILSWYRGQVKEFGVFPATWLLLRIVWRRGFVLLSNRFLPSRVECPCCGWRGRRFLDYIEMGYGARNTACPRCDSHSRHRALFLWLRDKYQVSEKSGRALIFAPERTLEPLWRSASKLMICKVDLDPARAVDVIADLMRLPFASDVADLIWCHHVLEQIEDDRVALNELYRACSSSGEMIVSVGSGRQATTLEFGFSDKRLSGNCRLFGKDFPARLAEAGFKVQALKHELSETECRTYGISPESFYLCTKH
jgi:SAM-dependent methyltransferase